MLIQLFFMITAITSFPTTKQIEKKILKLRPNMSQPKRQSRLRLIAETIHKYAPKSGFKTDADVNLIVAMMKKESDFAHIPGKAGEWGMLQVIPTERHIKLAAMKYRCHRSEIRKVYYPTIMCKRNKNGCKVTYRPCRKSGREGSNTYYANVGYFKDGTYSLLNWKTRLFVKHSVRGAIATGIREMRYWKTKYDRSLKRRYWTRFPTWYFKKRIKKRTSMNATRPIDKKLAVRSIKFHRRWWKKVTGLMGDRVWVSHYNWGSRLAPGRISRWYPKMVHKFLKVLEAKEIKTDAKS